MALKTNYTTNMTRHLLIITTLLLLTSCFRENCQNTEKINYLFAKQIQTFELSGNDSIVGNEGTILFINPKDLEFETGESINGKVQIELSEYYSKSDILGMNLSTLCDGQLLETAGMIEVNAFSKNQKLKLKKNATVKIKFPTNELSNDMELFNGEISNGTINWKSNRKTQINAAGLFFQDETFEAWEEAVEENYNALNYYILESKKLGWINCDKFYKLKNITNINVKADTVGRPIISLVFTELNSIMSGYYNKDKFLFKNIPIGSDVNCLGMKKVNDKFYFGYQHIKIEPNMEIELKLHELTEKELKEKIQSIDNK